MNTCLRHEVSLCCGCYKQGKCFDEPCGKSEARPHYNNGLYQRKEYVGIVFQQEGDAEEADRIFHEQGAAACFHYLLQWDYGEYNEISQSKPWGTTDHLFYFGNYVLSVNSGLPYYGLTKVI